MLGTQIVMNLLFDFGVSVDFVRHGVTARKDHVAIEVVLAEQTLYAAKNMAIGRQHAFA
jgi:hypothetical protein